MEIEIRHCNNIDFARITLLEGKLNIKYAANGSGKSSIAKALMCSKAGDQSRMSELMPFKFRKENPEGNRPEVSGAESLASIMCFNEDYAYSHFFGRQIAFQIGLLIACFWPASRI